MPGGGLLSKTKADFDKNGVLPVKLRLDERNHFINCLALMIQLPNNPWRKAKAIRAEIWQDAQHGDLDLSLNRCPPLMEGRGLDLLDALGIY